MTLTAATTVLVLQAGNILLRIPELVAQKRVVELGLMGADEFVLSRNVLSRGRLDLGAWWGHQEVRTRSRFSPSCVRLRARLGERAELSIQLLDDTGSGDGIEITGPGGALARSFFSAADGQFSSVRPIDQGPLEAGWHDVEIDLTTPGATLRIDGQLPQALGWTAWRGPRRLSLRANAESAQVADLNLRENDGHGFQESFRNTHEWGRIASLHLLAVAALVLLLVFFFRRGRRTDLMPVIAVVLGITVLVGSVLLFDEFFWSGLPLCSLTREYKGEHAVFSPVERIEQARYHLFGAWQRLLGLKSVSHDDLVAAGYPNERIWEGPIVCNYGPATQGRCAREDASSVTAGPRAGPVVAVIGTSQTIGAGATAVDNTSFARLCRHVFAALGSPSLRCINLAVSGSRSTLLFERWQSVLTALRPDLVIATFGCNDTPETLAVGLPLLLELDAALGARTLVVREAGLSSFADQFAVLDREAAAQGARIVDLHNYLADPQVLRSGFVYWDSVHLTDYGQALVADFLAPTVTAELRARRSSWETP